MTLTDAEVLGAGRRDHRDPLPAPWRRWLPRLVLPLAALTVVGVLLWEWQPWVSPPTTGVRLLIADADTLTWVDVDTGERSPVPAEPGWTDPLVVGDGVVVRYPSGDPVLADRVVGYRGDELPNEVGEADRLVPQQGSALWLVIDGDPPADGAVALTTAFGQWRSRVFSVPPRIEVVAASADGLVTTRGPFRYRVLELWDVQLGERIRGFGLVIGVREVRDDRALITTGCLTDGCTTAVLDLATGAKRQVISPPGHLLAGVPRLTDSGVAAAVIAPDGTPRLAVGEPDAPALVDLGDLVLARGIEPVPTADGWLVLTTSTGSAVLFGEQLEPERWPRVQLAEDERVVGVSG